MARGTLHSHLSIDNAMRTGDARSQPDRDGQRARAFCTPRNHARHAGQEPSRPGCPHGHRRAYGRPAREGTAGKPAVNGIRPGLRWAR